MNQIIDHVPSAKDLNIDQPSNSVSKTNASFESRCMSLFSVGRQVANYKQLELYLTLFLKSWIIFKAGEGKSYNFLYSATNMGGG